MCVNATSKAWKRVFVIVPGGHTSRPPGLYIHEVPKSLTGSSVLNRVFSVAFALCNLPRSPIHFRSRRVNKKRSSEVACGCGAVRYDWPKLFSTRFAPDLRGRFLCSFKFDDHPASACELIRLERDSCPVRREGVTAVRFSIPLRLFWRKSIFRTRAQSVSSVFSVNES